MIPIVDEGQFFDELCPTNKEGYTGARYAMRFLRELQYEVKLRNSWRVGHEHKVLGIMTGIDPQVSLPHRTGGTNMPFSAALHKMAGYAAIVDELVDHSKLKSEWVHCPAPIMALRKRRLAATFFPHVRELESFLNGGSLTLSSLQLPTNFVNPTDRDKVYDLVMATALQRDVTQKWNVRIPAVFKGGTDSDLSIFEPVMGTHMMIEAAQKFFGCPNCPDLMGYCTDVNPHDFERVTAFCLSALVALLNYQYANTEVPPTFPPEVVKDKINMSPDIFEWFKVKASSVRLKGLVKPHNSTGKYFPSSGTGSHRAAFTKNSALHPEWSLEMLKEVGDTVFFSCAGNAPVDFICVTLVGVMKEKEIEIGLIDAKQVTSESNGVALAPATVDDMKPRFKLVKEYLGQHLSPSYTVAFKRPAIVTTATDIKAAALAARTEADEAARIAAKAKLAAEISPSDAATKKAEAAADAADAEENNAIVLISPDTCTFTPLTDWWFSATKV